MSRLLRQQDLPVATLLGERDPDMHPPTDTPVGEDAQFASVLVSGPPLQALPQLVHPIETGQHPVPALADPAAASTTFACAAPGWAFANETMFRPSVRFKNHEGIVTSAAWTPGPIVISVSPPAALL